MEQPLPKDGACNLGSVNLSEYVIKPYSKEACFDMESFNKDLKIYIGGLDDVLEEGKELHALKEQRDMAHNYRNIGLGVMGLATMFMKLGIAYGDTKSKLLTEEIMKNMFNMSLLYSSLIAKEKGAFPKYNKTIMEACILENVTPEVMQSIKQHGLRNCSLLSIAPSGSISNAIGISGGLEPYYSLSYTRKTESLHGDKDVYYTIEVESSKKAREIFGDYPCVSAMDIDWRDRVDLQGLMQKYIDTAISSTVNVKEETSVEELRDLYLYAWKKGIKGITIYREGSFEAVMSTKTDNKEVLEDSKELPRGVMSEIPRDTIYYPREMNHGCGRAKVMVGYSPSENRIVDAYYINKGEGGCSKNTQGEFIFMSHVLRLGGNLEDTKKSFKGIDACTSCTVSRMRGNKVDGTNCPNILVKIVLDAQAELVDKNRPQKENYKHTSKVEVKNKIVNDSKVVCPECGEVLSPEGGCFTCHTCGYSKCD